jgi:hypothetical protein
MPWFLIVYFLTVQCIDSLVSIILGAVIDVALYLGVGTGVALDLGAGIGAARDLGAGIGNADQADVAVSPNLLS